MRSYYFYRDGCWHDAENGIEDLRKDDIFYIKIYTETNDNVSVANLFLDDNGNYFFTALSNPIQSDDSNHPWGIMYKPYLARQK